MSAAVTATTNNQLYAWHFSGWNNKYDNSYSSNVEYKAAIDDFRAKGGYRLSVDEVVLPAIVPKNTNFNLKVKIINSGVAPLYRKYYTLVAKLSPVAGGTDIIITLAGNLHGILPGETVNFSSNMISIEMMGEYQVSVGVKGDEVINPLPLSLANTGTISSGSVHWCPVGSLSVTWPSAVGEIHEIKDIYNLGAGPVKVLTLYGAQIRILPPGLSVKEWLLNTGLAQGVYVLQGLENTRLFFIQ
jgi:hypothetical protein